MQGEGPYVGSPTVFVRFGECDLRCAWCDSPGTWPAAKSCRFETSPGSGDFVTQPNPVSRDALEAALAALASGAHVFGSITGGEPLLQPDAVRDVAAALRAAGLRTYLETHGLASGALADVLDSIDVVSMDWKLASDVRRASDPRGERAADFHAAHERFLVRAQEAPEVFVKVVLTRRTEDAELEDLCRRIARSAPDTLLVLQPVTPFGPVRETPDAAQLLAWTRACAARLEHVRLIPQTHPVLGAL